MIKMLVTLILKKMEKLLFLENVVFQSVKRCIAKCLSKGKSYLF